MSVVRRSSIFYSFSLDPLDLSSIANTRAYWKETPVALAFKVDLPGLKKEMVKVEVVEGRILQIGGDRSLEQEEKNDSWHRVQRSSAKFRRRFRLRKNAKVDQISASVDDGVLAATFPTVEARTSQMKSIQISG